MEFGTVKNNDRVYDIMFHTCAKLQGNQYDNLFTGGNQELSLYISGNSAGYEHFLWRYEYLNMPDMKMSNFKLPEKDYNNNQDENEDELDKLIE